MSDHREGWEAGIEWLLSELLPGTPVHVVTPSHPRLRELGVTMAGFKAAAFTAPSLAFLLGVGVGDDPGLCMVVDRDQCKDDWGTEAIALHEAAHHLSDQRPVRSRHRSLGPAIVRDALQSMETLPPPVQRPRPWAQHEARFVRMLCHLMYRARRLGSYAQFHDAFQCGHYLLPSGDEWNDALGDEPQQLCGLHLDEVATFTPPIAYQQFAKQALADAEREYESLYPSRVELERYRSAQSELAKSA